MRLSVRSAPVVLVAAGILAVTGCSGDDEPSAAATPDASASASVGDDAPDASGAGVDEADLDAVQVEQTLVAVDDPDSSLEVGVLSLEVEDEVMRLELVLTPDVASVSDDKRQNLWDLNGFYSEPFLIDRDNLKRYEVVSAGFGERYQSDPVQTQTVNGRPMRVYYYFAAPQDGIDAIDLVLSDRYPAFTDIPIS